MAPFKTPPDPPKLFEYFVFFKHLVLFLSQLLISFEFGVTPLVPIFNRNHLYILLSLQNIGQRRVRNGPVLISLRIEIGHKELILLRHNLPLVIHHHIEGLLIALHNVMIISKLRRPIFF